MDGKEAANILRSLADGKNPETGLEIDNNDVLSQPDVIRALFSGANSLMVMKKKRKHHLRGNVMISILQACCSSIWSTHQRLRLRRGV